MAVMTCHDMHRVDLMPPAKRTPPATRPVPSPALLDVARGLAMVIVLYGHALEVFFLDRPDDAFFREAFVQYKVLASFAMPLFFMVSGAAAAKLPAKGWRNVLKTSLYLLILAYLVHALGLLGLAAGLLLGKEGSFPELIRFGLDSSLKGRSFSTIVVWFLVSLAMVRLIAYGLFGRFPQAGYAIIALAGLASLLVPALPNAFMLKTWFPGLAFFGLGMMLAAELKRAALRWALLLAPLVAWLALANRGCAYDPVGSCPLPGLPGEAVVWLHDGATGFIPLFYLTALLGCAVALALAQLLVRFAPASPGLAPLLAGIGRRSLDLLLINGFVLVFLQPELKRIPLEGVGLWAFPLLLIVVVAFHLAVLAVLKRPLAALLRLASWLADLALAALTPLAGGWGQGGRRLPPPRQG